MSAEARRWVSPALCGCELEITAEWASKEAADGKMYSHPASAPGLDKSGQSRNTVQFVRIITQCATHAGWEASLQWAPFAVMGGYCDLDTTAGDGVWLYANHWRFTNILTRLALCDCAPNHRYDATADSFEVHQHPHHTNRCKVHADDDDKHTKALKAQRVHNAVRDAHPDLLITLDADGLVELDTKHMTPADAKALRQVVAALPDADAAKVK